MMSGPAGSGLLARRPRPGGRPVPQSAERCICGKPSRTTDALEDSDLRTLPRTSSTYVTVTAAARRIQVLRVIDPVGKNTTSKIELRDVCDVVESRIHRNLRLARWSATRNALAWIVSVGLAPPEVGMKQPSVTYRLSKCQARQSGSSTESSRVACRSGRRRGCGWRSRASRSARPTPKP